MKKIIIFLLIWNVAHGQTPTGYTKINAKYDWIAGKFDSTITIPFGSTPSVRSGYDHYGNLFYKTSDSTVYVYTGTQWIKVTRSTTSGTVTSVATGYGLSGGTITSTGTILVDTATLFPAIRATTYNIYNTSGTLTGTRMLNGSSLYGINFDSLNNTSFRIVKTGTTYIRRVATNGTDSAYDLVQKGGIATTFINQNTITQNSTGWASSIINKKPSSGLQYIEIGLRGTGAQSTLTTDSVRAVLYKSNVSAASAIEFYNDSISIYSTPGTIQMGSKRARQYADDSLIWATTDRTALLKLSPNLTEIYGGSSEIELSNSGVEVTGVANGGVAADSVVVITSGNILKRRNASSFAGGGSGVTSVATSNGITGGTITSTGTISGINAAADGSTKGVSAYTANDFDASSGVISIDYANGQKASGSVSGFVSTTTQTIAGAKNFTADMSITPASDDQTTLTIKTNGGNPAIQLGTYPSAPTYGGLWFGNITPSGSNYTIASTGSQTLVNASSSLDFRIANNSINPALSINSGSQIGFGNTGPSAGFTAKFGENGFASGSIQLAGTSAGTLGIVVPASFTSYNYWLPTGPGTSGQVLTSAGAGVAQTWTDAPSSGTFTPTATSVTNISSSTPANSQYTRVGNIVTVYGKVAIVATGAGSAEVGISLPVASNIGAVTDLNGTGTSTNAGDTSIRVEGDATNDRASIKFSTVTGGTIYFTFSYTVI